MRHGPFLRLIPSMLTLLFAVGQVQRAASVRADVRSALVGSPGGLWQREERRALLSQQRQGLFVLLQVSVKTSLFPFALITPVKHSRPRDSTRAIIQQ